jgi:hypothetical protein
MAPIKFEEQLKDKLEKRTLSPSADSWAKLSERLDADEKKSKNPLFWLMGIAAGVIIMIAVSIQFFKTGDTEKVMPQVVEESIEKSIQKSKDPQLHNIETIDLVNEEDANAEEINKANTANKAQIIEYKNVTQNKPKSKVKLAENSKPAINNSTTENVEEANPELKIANDEIILKDAVATAINDIKTDNTSVTDREIDSLLKVASKELFKSKLQKETSKTVDANKLLDQVQEDMGQSFRTKVFEALKDSYETVKTAVAERNN